MNIKNVFATAIIVGISFISIPVFAEIIRINATGQYTVGDGPDENISVAKQRARIDAMRSATEKAGVYIESYTKTQDMVLTVDEVKAISAQILKIISDDIDITADGKLITFTCNIVADVDTSNLEKINYSTIGNNNAELELEIEHLKQELSTLKLKYNNTNDDTVKHFIVKKIADNEVEFERLEKSYISYYRDVSSISDFVDKNDINLSHIYLRAQNNLKSSSIKVIPNHKKWKQYAENSKGWVWWYDPTSIKVIRIGDQRVKVKICFYKPNWGYVISDYTINYTKHYFAQMTGESYREENGKMFHSSNEERNRDYIGKHRYVDVTNVNPYSVYGYFRKYINSDSVFIK